MISTSNFSLLHTGRLYTVIIGLFRTKYLVKLLRYENKVIRYSKYYKIQHRIIKCSGKDMVVNAMFSTEHAKMFRNKRV